MDLFMQAIPLLPLFIGQTMRWFWWIAMVYFVSSKASNLKRHLMWMCGYQYSQAGSLQEHLKIHRGEKAKQCNQCQYASIRADSLRTHLKKTQWRKADLMNHMGQQRQKYINFTRRMKVKVYNLVRQIIYWWRIIYWCLVYDISGTNYLNFRHFTIRHILLTLQA